jgi:DnaJ-domain-containing protein 1
LLNEFASDFADASELKETFLFGMGLVAMADGSLHAREAELLADAASILSIPLKEANRILGSLGVSLGAKQRTHHRPANPTKSPAKYYAVLGVSESATKEEVKIAFRGLCLRSKCEPRSC